MSMRMEVQWKKFLQKYHKEIASNIILLIVISMLSILGPLLLKEAIDYDLESGFKTEKIVLYIIVLTILYGVKFFYNRFRFWFEEKFKNIETEALYRKVFTMSYEKINELEPTYIAERISSTINTIFSLYSTSISGIFVSALTMLFILCVIIRIDKLLAFLYFLQIPIQYFGFQRLLNGENSKLSQYGIKLQEISAKNNKNIKAVISDVNSIKQYGENTGILSFIRKYIQETNHVAREGNRYAMDMCTILEYICQIVKNTSYLLIIYLYVTGRATVGDIVYLNLMNDIYFSSVGDVISIQVNLRDLKAAMKFIVDEIEKNQESDGKISIKRIECISGKIAHIGYKGIELIERGEFEFHRGDVIVLKGKSGTGKSTFVKLLNKFLVADGIYINDKNINEISNLLLREKIFYLAQNAYLLPLSIKENITLGEMYTEESWEKLLGMDFMQKFVRLENGLETMVYENAANLSGGDRQKIILGRIFLKNPDVIILDESFNAMDEKMGEEIVSKIIELYADRIIIIISHSEKYLKKCNIIVKIEDKQLLQKRK